MGNLKEKLYNYYLLYKNNIGRRLSSKVKDFDPKGLTLDVHEDFSKLTKQWQKTLWWGTHSDDADISYNDKSCTNLVEGGVRLSTEFSPKLNKKNNKTMDFKTGILFSKKTYFKGAMEVIVNMKAATGIWHAPLWFVTDGTEKELDYKVLPEIDVIEIYTKNKATKSKPQTNIHYGEDYGDNAKNIGAHTHYIPNEFGRDVSFAIIWNDDKIELYYDGFLVRKITNKNILERIKGGLVPIIGTSVNKGHPHNGSEMTVKSFKYWK